MERVVAEQENEPPLPPQRNPDRVSIEMEEEKRRRRNDFSFITYSSILKPILYKCWVFPASTEVNGSYRCSGLLSIRSLGYNPASAECGPLFLSGVWFGSHFLHQFISTDFSRHTPDLHLFRFTFIHDSSDFKEIGWPDIFFLLSTLNSPLRSSRGTSIPRS